MHYDDAVAYLSREGEPVLQGVVRKLTRGELMKSQGEVIPVSLFVECIGSLVSRKQCRAALIIAAHHLECFGEEGE